ncbi:hypothetical protein BDR26DRAFT_871737, partial [Obelidium mucronatum]
MDLLPSRVDYKEIETEVKDALALVTKMLPVRQQHSNSNNNNNTSHKSSLGTTSTQQSTSRDSSWFRKASGALSQVKNLIQKHSQNLLEGQMYKDYITFFSPLALEVADSLPIWDDPKNNKLSQTIYRRICSGLRLSLSKIKVIDGSADTSASTGSVPLTCGVLADELDILVRHVKRCKGFNEELGEFRAVLEAIEVALDRTV